MRIFKHASLWLSILLALAAFLAGTVLAEDINIGNDPDIPDDTQSATVTAKIGSNDAWMNTTGSITRSGVFGDASTGSGSVEATVLGDGTGSVKSKTTALVHQPGQIETFGNSCQSLKPMTFNSGVHADGTVVNTDIDIHFDGLLTVKEEIGGGSESEARVEFLAEIQQFNAGTGERDPIAGGELDGGVAWITDDGAGGVTVNVPATYVWMEGEPAGNNRWFGNPNLSIRKIVPAGTVVDPATEIDIDDLPNAETKAQAAADLAAGRHTYYLEYDETINFNATVGETYFMAMDLQTAAGCLGGSGDASFAQADFSNTINYTFSGANLNLVTNVEVSGSEDIDSTNFFGGASSTTTMNNGTLNWGGNFNLGCNFNMAGGTTNTFNTGTFSPTASGVLSGNGALVKTGTGMLTLTGDSSAFGGSTSVETGTLAINGLLGGNVAVGSGGTLGGTGTIGGNVTGGGTVAPGNSIGTLNIGGDYTPAAGAVLEIEINNAASDQIIVAGNADVTAATLRGVALEEITADREYRFMTATAITGPFNVLDTAVLDFTAELRAGDTEYWMLVSRQAYQNVAQTFNQTSIARALDADYAGAVGDMAAVYAALDAMGAPALRAAYNQMSGPIYGDYSVIDRANTNFLYGLIANRLRSETYLDSGPHTSPYGGNCPNGWTGWMAGYGRGGTALSDANAPGFNYSVGGLLAVIERSVAHDVQLGLFYNYGKSFVKTNNGWNESGEVDSNHWGGYLKKLGQEHYMILAGGFGYDTYQTTRVIQAAPLSRRANSTHDGWQSSLYAEYGGIFGNTHSTFQPFVGLNYIYVRQNSAVETGAGALNLNVGGNDLSALRTLLGCRLASTYSIAAIGAPEIDIHAFWTHDMLKRVYGLANMSLGGATPFPIRGVDLGRDWVTVGPGLTWQIGPQCRVFTNYNLAFNSQASYHMGNGGVELCW